MVRPKRAVVVRPGEMKVVELYIPIYITIISPISAISYPVFILRTTYSSCRGDKVIITISSYCYRYYYKTSWRSCTCYCRRADSLYDDIVIIIMITSYAIIGRANRITCDTSDARVINNMV